MHIRHCLEVGQGFEPWELLSQSDGFQIRSNKPDSANLPLLVGITGFEPVTFQLSVECTTAVLYPSNMVSPSGLEPET